MTRETQQQILELSKSRGALRFGDFVLSSGQRSSYYFDGRLLTLDPQGAYLVGKAIFPQVQAWGAEAVGGPTLGADPMVSAVILTSYLEGHPVRGFLVRKEAKEHGTSRLIEGPLDGGQGKSPRVAIMDDTCSTGGNLFHAIAAAEAEGCQVVGVAVVLDRHQGGSDRLRERGYPFSALLEADPEGGIRVASKM